MSVRIRINGNELAVRLNLTQIVGPSADVMFDLVPKTATDLQGNQIIEAPTGEVTFADVGPFGSLPVGYSVVRQLVQNEDFLLEIRGETSSAFVYKPSDPSKTLWSEGGAVTLGPMVTANYTMVQIVYDIAACNGKGYGVIGQSTGKEIDSPPDVYLFHELVHAFHHMKKDFGANPELQVVADHPGENDYRAMRKPALPLRTTGPHVHDGLAHCPAPSPPPPPPMPAPAPASSGSCFPARTPVLTKRGYQPIQSVEVGFTVVSYDAKRNQTGERLVSKKIVHASGRIWRIVTSGSGGIETTANQTFLTRRGWLRAKNLREGDEILTGLGNTAVPVRVLAFVDTGRDEPVYHLHTVGEHNFIAHGCVAHNFTYFRAVRTLWHRVFVDPFLTAPPEPRRIHANFGGPNEGNTQPDASSWFYTVTFTNNTDVIGPPTPFDLAMFFKSKDVTNGVQFQAIQNVLPGSTQVFALSSCDQLISYAFGVFVGDEMVASVPPDLENDPPIAAGSPDDTSAYEDSYIYP